MVNRNPKAEIQKPKIRRGDTVKVLAGKDRGKTARVMAVLPREGRVLVEGINMVSKHIRPRRAGEKGQRVSVAAPLALSKVQPICGSCKKSTRVAIKREGNVRQRVCKKCQALFDT
jgi:large subunit ribosomal protein L24